MSSNVKIDLRDAIICWSGPKGEIEVIAIGGYRPRRIHEYSDGADFVDWRERSFDKKRWSALLELFVSLTVIWGINPEEIHENFMQIKEYAAAFKEKTPIWKQ